MRVHVEKVAQSVAVRRFMSGKQTAQAYKKM
jgi:hypothetical protein